MTQHVSVNFSGANEFEYADDLDDHVIPEDIQGVGFALHAHDHSNDGVDAAGLPVGRVKNGLAAARPAANAGYNVYIATDTGVTSFSDGVNWHSVMLLDVVQTISAILKFDAGMDWKQIATPANPAAGYSRVYVKSDGNLYTLSSAGTESLVGPLPTGMAVPYFGTVLPANTLWADGHSDVVATYSRLSGIIRPTLGGADASHFYVPDLRSRMPMGADNYGSGAAGRTAAALAGTAGGEDTHALSTAELATHSHANSLTDNNHTHLVNATSSGDTQGAFAPLGVAADAGPSGVPSAAPMSITNANAGSGTAHNNRPLYLGCNWVIGV